MEFNYFTYREEDVTCPNCAWQGKALLPGEFFSEEHFIAELVCPGCHKDIGYWQAPLLTEVAEWKRTHPGWEP